MVAKDAGLNSTQYNAQRYSKLSKHSVDKQLQFSSTHYGAGRENKEASSTSQYASTIPPQKRDTAARQILINNKDITVSDYSPIRIKASECELVNKVH